MIKNILKKNYVHIISIFLLILLFLFVENSNIYKSIIEFDYKVIEKVYTLYDTRLVEVMKFMTKFAEWYIPCSIIVCIFLFIKNKKYGLVMSINYVISAVVAFVTKELVARPRPLSALIKIPSSHSFPSGHTLTALVFYISLSYLMTKNYNKQTKIITLLPFITISILISLSRIYLGVHFFSDVIGGYLLAIPCTIIAINIIKEIIGDN